MTRAAKDETDKRVIRVEGFILTLFIGALSILANYTLNNISESLHDTAAQVKEIGRNVGDMNTQLASLGVSMNDLADRVDRDERIAQAFKH